MEKYRIKELLKEKGLTQKDLAERMGITPSTLSQMLKGNMTISTINRIVSALEVTAFELLSPEVFDTFGEDEQRQMINEAKKVISDKLEKGRFQYYAKQEITITCPHCGKEIPLKIDIEALKNLNNKG